MKPRSDLRRRFALRSALAVASWLLSLAIAASLPSAGLAASGGGGGGGGTIGAGGGPPPAARRSPEELAQQAYEKGLRARDRALAHEAEAEEKDEPGFLGLGKRPSEKAADQWLDAAAAYREAIASQPDFYEAHNELGFAYRKIGNYERALSAYDQSLRIRSDYGPAIEYRAEAYLHLGRLEDAKRAYGELFRSDRALADQLMEAMQTWLAEAATEPVQGVSPEALESFRDWLAQRALLAGQVPKEVSHPQPW